MKKLKYLIILCLMFIPVLNINAEEKEQIKNFHVVAGDSITSSSDIDGSSIVAGDNVTVENTVKGIDMVFGNNVNYKSNSDYSLIMGNAINLNGTTNNDGFIFGSAITFDKEYKSSRDLFVFGSSIILRGEITRDVKIYASTVVLEDVKIDGNITINATSIEVKNASINSLSYNDDAEINISNEAVVNEKNTFTIEKEYVQDIVISNIIDYASMLFTFAILALVIPSLFKKLENKLSNISISNFISMLGYGIFLLILIPILFALLITTQIGIPLALLLLISYIIVIFLSTIITGYFVGLIIWKKFIKKELNVLLAGLIGISVIKILSLIPYVGVITTLISLLLSFSIIIKLFTKDA